MARRGVERFREYDARGNLADQLRKRLTRRHLTDEDREMLEEAYKEAMTAVTAQRAGIILGRVADALLERHGV